MSSRRHAADSFSTASRSNQPRRLLQDTANSPSSADARARASLISGACSSAHERVWLSSPATFWPSSVSSYWWRNDGKHLAPYKTVALQQRLGQHLGRDAFHLACQAATMPTNRWQSCVTAAFWSRCSMFTMPPGRRPARAVSASSACPGCPTAMAWSSLPGWWMQASSRPTWRRLSRSNRQEQPMLFWPRGRSASLC